MGKAMSEEDVMNFLAWPHTNICSDGSTEGHPRGYGAFTRVLGRYVREKQLFALETAIHKMTALSAEHTGIKNRGIIAPGFSASTHRPSAARAVPSDSRERQAATSRG